MSIKLTPRKSPRQGRAKATVDAMLEAAVRLTRSKGLEPWTTNQAAELAGVSIGTLYQYFPSKESLVTSLAVHRRESRLNELEADLATRDGATLGARIVAALVALYQAEPDMDAELERYLASIGAGRKLAPFDARAAGLIATYLGNANPGLDARTGKIIARAAVACVAASALEEPSWLVDPAFRDDVARLVDAPLAAAVR